MLPDLQSLSLQDLSDLLIAKTNELLRLTKTRGANSKELNNLIKEVEKVQHAFKLYWQKKTEQN